MGELEEDEESGTEESDSDADDDELTPLGRNLDDALPYDIFNRLIGGFVIQWHRGPENKPWEIVLKIMQGNERPTFSACHFYADPPIKCVLDTKPVSTQRLRRKVTLPDAKNASFESLTITDMTVTGFDHRTPRSCGHISMIMHLPKTQSEAGLDTIIFLSGKVKVTSLKGSTMFS